MENFNEIINYIGRTNLFNFAIFLSIIIFLIKKIDISTKLKESQTAVNNSIYESESAKYDSEEKLKELDEIITNIDSELEEIVTKSVSNAKIVGEKLIEDANKTALTIRDNTNKAIENSKMILKNELLKRASLASVEVAKNHIINELSWNQGLHDKLIDESLETIGGLEL